MIDRASVINERLLPDNRLQPADKRHLFEYRVEKRNHGDEAHPGFLYEASIPYRGIVWIGQTEEEAIGCMLKGVAELSWQGSLDPNAPHRPGRPPIQQALQLLEQALSYSLERRREKIEAANNGYLLSDPDMMHAQTIDLKNLSTKPVVTSEAPLLNDASFLRNNEIIAGLATAIAALGRVKEL